MPDNGTCTAEATDDTGVLVAIDETVASDEASDGVDEVTTVVTVEETGFFLRGALDRSTLPPLLPPPLLPALLDGAACFDGWVAFDTGWAAAMAVDIA